MPEHNELEPSYTFEQPFTRARMDERDLLSIDLSAHPLDHYLNVRDITQMKDLLSLKIGAKVKLVGGVIRYQTPPTKNGNRVVYIIMGDGTALPM